MWNPLGKNTGVGSHSCSGEPSSPGTEPGSPALRADSLPPEPPETRPLIQDTGVTGEEGLLDHWDRTYLQLLESPEKPPSCTLRPPAPPELSRAAF